MDENEHIWPWRTLANVNGTGPISPQFNAGDNIYLKRGQKWNDRITVNNVKAALAIRRSGSYNGSEINYITVADFIYDNEDPNLPKPIIHGNGLDCAIYLDQDFIYIKNLDITINKNIITPILSLLLLDSSNEDTSENTISTTYRSFTLPPIPSESPPPAPTPKRSYLPPPCRVIPALPPSYVDPPVLPPVLPATPLSAEIPAGFFLTPEGELIPIPAATSALTSDPLPLLPPEEETAAATGVRGKGIRIQPSGNNYTVENNIVIESCDVHDFAASGISIGSNRGYITIKGTINGDNSTSNIYNNRQNGIEVFIAPEQAGEAVNIKNKIDGCSIDNNTWNGITLRGDQATIANNNIYSNGNEIDSYSNPTHNIYLYGDHGNVYGNYIALSGSGGNGCGFRYSGSYLNFGGPEESYANRIKDNYTHGIGLWSNDYNDCVGNNIINNIIYVKNTGIAVNNFGISIGYGNSLFAQTTIKNNKIYGYHEADTIISDQHYNAGGIGIQPCDTTTPVPGTDTPLCIRNNSLSCLKGPQIQIEEPADKLHWFYSLPNDFCDFNRYLYYQQDNEIWFDAASKNDGDWGWSNWHDHVGYDPHTLDPSPQD